jgi:hypothetical protein
MCRCIYESPTLHQKGAGNCINKPTDAPPADEAQLKAAAHSLLTALGYRNGDSTPYTPVESWAFGRIMATLQTVSAGPTPAPDPTVWQFGEKNCAVCGKLSRGSCKIHGVYVCGMDSCECPLCGSPNDVASLLATIAAAKDQAGQVGPASDKAVSPEECSGEAGPLALSVEDKETIYNVLIHEAYALKEDSESETFHGLETKEDLAKTAEHLGAVATRFRAAPTVDVEAVMEVATEMGMMANPKFHTYAAKLRKAVGRE